MSDRRFYALPCWVMDVDGERFCVCSNTRIGAEQGAILAWQREHGRRLPLRVEARGFGG